MSKTRYRVLPYKQGSKGAKALATELGGLVLKVEGSNYKPRPDDVVINWGGSDNAPRATVNNDRERLASATNKLTFFQSLKGSGLTPDFWTRKEDIPESAFPVVARTILSGHSGAGIVIGADRASLPDCPLYVRYIKKKDEYRVHVGKGGKIISLQQKKRRQGFENPNWQVRNHGNGFVYVRDNINPPEQVVNVALQAFSVLGLDFGAVDVIWNEHDKRAYVLEINTAPGLEGQTVKDYADYFRERSLR